MKTLALALTIFVSPAIAQQANTITVKMTPDEAQFILGAASHEIQLACMFGQCAAVSPAALTLPKKVIAAEQDAANPKLGETPSPPK